MKRKYIIPILAALLVLSGCLNTDRESEPKAYTEIGPTLTVDFSAEKTEFKPVNGINNGPVSGPKIVSDKLMGWNFDATETYRNLEIPIVRTQGSGGKTGQVRFIDIHCIFPDMSKDPEDEEAYDFKYTDAYIGTVRASGAEVYYRLGESAASSPKTVDHQKVPGNMDKWAEVCAHIVAHYNDGWKNGFYYGIRYWQIWNEPDQPLQWTGSMEEYGKLYRITARRLKKQFPDILIGASAPSSVSEADLQTFLDSIRTGNERPPLDFFGWHAHTDDPGSIGATADLVRSVLDENGYEDTLTFLDEWNCADDPDGETEEAASDTVGDPSAAFCASCLIAAQDAPIDGAMYCESPSNGESSLCGLYDANGDYLPGYYGFWLFSRLKRIGGQVTAVSTRAPSESGVYVCAASGDGEDGILIANDGRSEIRFLLISNSAHGAVKITRFDPADPGLRTVTDENFSEREIMVMKSGELVFIRFSDDRG